MKNLSEKAQRDDELFDIVDENDQVIGQASRRETHEKKLRHRAVHAWVFNGNAQVFLQKRSLLKDTAPGKWDSSCSGHLDAGENYDTAIIRELKEEIGLTVSPSSQLACLFKVKASEDSSWEFTQVYRLFAEGPFSLHPAEIETGDWFAQEEIDKRIRETPDDFSRNFRLFWAMRPEDITSVERPPVPLQ